MAYNLAQYRAARAAFNAAEEVFVTAVEAEAVSQDEFNAAEQKLTEATDVRQSADQSLEQALWVLLAALSGVDVTPVEPDPPTE